MMKNKIKIFVFSVLIIFGLLFFNFQLNDKDDVHHFVFALQNNNGAPLLDTALAIDRSGKLVRTTKNINIFYPKTKMSQDLDFQSKTQVKRLFSDMSGIDESTILKIIGNDNSFLVTVADSEWEYNNFLISVYKIDVKERKYSKLYTSYSYGGCSDVLEWKKDLGILILSINEPISSESYITGFCVRDDKNGEILRSIDIPESESMEFYLNLVAKSQNTVLLVRNKLDSKELYIVDLDFGKILKLDQVFDDHLGLVLELTNNDVLLEIGRGKYQIFNLKSNKFQEPFQIQSDYLLSKKSFISSDEIAYLEPFNLIVFEEFVFEDINNRCYWIYDISSSVFETSFCASDFGWEKNSYRFVGLATNL